VQNSWYDAEEGKWFCNEFAALLVSEVCDGNQFRRTPKNHSFSPVIIPSTFVSEGDRCIPVFSVAKAHLFYASVRRDHIITAISSDAQPTNPMQPYRKPKETV
jgi:hypothetical protein